MSFRTILGRAFLTSTDWIIINSDLDKIRAYTAEILEQERRKEEKRKAAEARERARKAEEARLAAIRKAEEERKRAEGERKREEERLARRRAEQKILDDLLREDEARYAAIQTDAENGIDGFVLSHKDLYGEDEDEEEENEEDEDDETPMPEVHLSPISGSFSLDNRTRFSALSPKKPDHDVRYSISDDYAYSDDYALNRLHEIDDILENPAVSRGIRLDMTFCEKLRQFLSQKRMASTDVYKAANVEKSLFSKIYNNKEYKPNKDTAVSIALGLELTLEEAEDLLGRAGYMLSHSDVRDIVLECCFRKKIYNVIEVNIILDKLGYKPLSRVSY